MPLPVVSRFLAQAHLARMLSSQLRQPHVCANRLSEENSQGYFSNDNFTPSIYKLGVNGFENSFFTKSISSKMIAPNIIKSLIILILFLFVIFYTDQSTLISLVQIVLPFTIIQQTVRLIIFHSHVNKVFDNYKHIYSNVAKTKRGPLIINNVINYEKTHAF